MQVGPRKSRDDKSLGLSRAFEELEIGGDWIYDLQVHCGVEHRF